MMVILFCKGENEVLKTICFKGTYTQAEDYINDRAEIPEGTTRTLIVPEENYIFNIDESLRRENEAFEQSMMRENYQIHKRKKIMEKELTEVACDAYCKCCDTKECEDLGEFNDFNCGWVRKFSKLFTKKLNKYFKTKQQWKKN